MSDDDDDYYCCCPRHHSRRRPQVEIFREVLPHVFREEIVKQFVPQLVVERLDRRIESLNVVHRSREENEATEQFGDTEKYEFALYRGEA